MTTPSVSIVIPLHNAEEWIAETLASVAAQTGEAQESECEIIVVDDGSVDRSVEAAGGVLSAGTVPFEIIRLRDNGGPSRARNVGWHRARGAWIQFLDSDDLLAPGKLRHQLCATRDRGHEAAVVYSEWQSLTFTNGTWAPSGPVLNPQVGDDPVQEILRTENFIHLGSSLIQRAWLDRVGGFDETRRFIEDVDLALRLSMAGGTFLRAPAGCPLFYYRRRGRASLSGSSRAGFLDGCLRNLRLAEHYWSSKDRLTSSRRQFLLDCYEPLLRNLATVDPRAFERVLRHVRTIDPAWIPRRDRRMALVSRIVGYRTAERLATGYRVLKGAVACR